MSHQEPPYLSFLLNIEYCRLHNITPQHHNTRSPWTQALYLKEMSRCSSQTTNHLPLQTA
jgi:hypothetical protein